MSYCTYFTGEMDIELKGKPLKDLQQYLSENMKQKDAIIVDEESLKVDAEWKDCGLMQKIILFIYQKGTINSGRILCEGEDKTDIWQIFIWDKKPFMKEIGTSMRIWRPESKGWFDVSKTDNIVDLKTLK